LNEGTCNTTLTGYILFGQCILW